MALNITKALNIENEERGVVLLLLIQSVFLGIFAGAIDVGANALFLSSYSADQMPKAFMISGLVGIVFTAAYTYLQKRIPFKLFTIINLLIVILLTAAIRFGYRISDDERLAFIALVFMGPLIIISMLGFWGTAGRYFTLREGKRLFGIIDTGSVVGMVLAFYAVPVLIRFNFKVYDTLLIGLISLIVALAFQVMVLQRHKLFAAKVKPAVQKRKNGFISLFRNPYTSMMAFFIVLSVITGFFIHYSFMWATEANYPDPRELTSFLGAFFGTMMIFTVVIKSTLYAWLMKNYGLKVSLIISPVLLLVLTLVAAFVGGLFGFGAEAASFTLFFLLIALSKLFNKSLKDAIESPSMKILYQSLDASERFDVQARIDGVVNELTAFATGVLMAGLLLLKFVAVIHFSYILIFVLALWVILGLRLYKAYRKTLNDSLADARASTVVENKKDFQSFHPLTEVPLYSEMIRLNPYFYHVASQRGFDSLYKSDDQRQLEFAWNYLEKTLYVFEDGELEALQEKNTNKELDKLIKQIGDRNKTAGLPLFKSSSKEDILSSLIKTIRAGDVKQIPHLITLFRDRDMQIRAAAIEAAGRLKVKELGTYLVDYIDHPVLYPTAWSALVNMGELVLENLENTFHKSGASIKVQLRIVRAMVAIGGEEVNELLFRKLNFHQREVRRAVVNGLLENAFVPQDQHMAELQDCIYEMTYAGAWNIAAQYVVSENDPANGLLEAIAEEKKRTDDILFKLLAIAYDRSSVEHVRTSIEDPENEDLGFALELLNLIVDEQHISYLETYFDDIAIVEKIRRLQNEMPLEFVSYGELLKLLISRDELYVGSYLRICAIDAISKHEELDAGSYLAAQAFHPHPVIRGSALETLSLKDPALYKDLLVRMKADQKAHGTAYLPDQVSAEILQKAIEDLKQWPVFASADRSSLFRLARLITFKGDIDLDDESLVSLIRSSRSDVDMVFQKGTGIIAPDHYQQLDQIKYLAQESETTMFQLRTDDLRDLLFDSDILLESFVDMFCFDAADELFKEKTN